MKNTANEVVACIVADVHFLNLPEFGEFHEYILVKQVKVLLQLLGVHAAPGLVCRVLVDVWEQQRLRELWLGVLAGALVAVAARPDLEEEGAVDSALVNLLVFLCAVDGRQVIGHFGQVKEND